MYLNQEDKKMKNLVVLTGAGMSAESGIRRFVMQEGFGTSIRWSRWLPLKDMLPIRSW